jgi:hypothetical protein
MNGGNMDVVVKPQPALSYQYPQFLPDGKSFLYDRGVPGSFTRNQIVMRSIDKDDETIILEGSYHYTYLKPGIIVYIEGSDPRSLNLKAIAFDASARKVVGSPVTIGQRVAATTAGTGAQFAVSENGTLVYLPALADGSQSRMVRVSQTGQVEVLAAEPRLYSDPRVSGDGHARAHLR